jgi:hypothetical protein
MVSLHVPAHNEPPDMVIETLRSLLRLDYPRFEVIVIDDNTDDEDLWRPVEAWCERHRVKFAGPAQGITSAPASPSSSPSTSPSTTTSPSASPSATLTPTSSPTSSPSASPTPSGSPSPATSPSY